MMLKDELIAFVCDVRFEDLPAPVVETAKPLRARRARLVRRRGP
jgi:hypothetical protein